MRRVTIQYSPRRVFLPFHETDRRFAVIVAHRRCGKTVACINRLIQSALSCQLPNPRCAYIAPLFNQAKDVAWTYLKEYARQIPGTRIHEAELRVDLPNGGRVRLYGADNPDRMRGLYLDDVVLDEFADMDPRLWSEVIRPALSDRRGRAVFIGTPKGRNAFANLYDQARKDRSVWFTAMLKASETGILSKEELEAARQDMTQDQYDQEYECSFDAAVEGTYYARLIAEIEGRGQIREVPYDPVLPVETWWDLGVADATSIWFVQREPRTGMLRVIDYLEHHGEGLPYYVRVLHEKGYAYSRHIAPHDLSVREFGSGRSRLETARSLGLDMTVAPNMSVADGIEAGRQMIVKAYFDEERCDRGLSALRQYRKLFDHQKGAFKRTPLHDWTSHAADAWRTGSVMAPELQIDYDKINPLKGSHRRSMTAGRSGWMAG